MPAYFAAKTLASVYNKIPKGCVDEIIVVDDCSPDDIGTAAKSLNIRFFKNEKNLGYGGNLKMCIQKSLEAGGDILIELHPDDQYDPSSIPEALEKIREGYDFVMGSRFLIWKEALRNAMPFWKYTINRLSTLPSRLLLGVNLTDFHSGFRIYRRSFLESIPYKKNNDDYLFSYEIIAQAGYGRFRVAEVPIICRYFPDATQISFSKCIKYGWGALRTLFYCVLAKIGLKHRIFSDVQAAALKS